MNIRGEFSSAGTGSIYFMYASRSRFDVIGLAKSLIIDQQIMFLSPQGGSSVVVLCCLFLMKEFRWQYFHFNMLI